MCKKVGDKVTVLEKEYILLHELGAWHLKSLETGKYFLYMPSVKKVIPCTNDVTGIYNQKDKTLSFLGLTFKLREGYDCSVYGTRVFTTIDGQKIAFEFPKGDSANEDCVRGTIVCVE